MKKNILIPIICATLLGYFCAAFIFNQYGVESLVFDDNNGNIYFLQCGAYTNLETSNKDLSNITNKITIKEDNKYYSYIGMTLDYEIALEIQKMYKENNIDIYIKSKYLEQEDFINQVRQYDVLLKSSTNLDEINSILETILATFEEFFINS